MEGKSSDNLPEWTRIMKTIALEIIEARGDADGREDRLEGIQR